MVTGVSWVFLQLCFCSVWGRCPAERGEQTLRCAQLSARLSEELCSPDLWRYYTILRCTFYTFYGPWIESFQDSWWDPEFPQLSQMVQHLPGFLHLSLNVCSPSQVLGDVYTEVLEATHPLHRGPTDHKRNIDNTEFLFLVVLIILIKAVDYTMCEYISSQYQTKSNIVFRRWSHFNSLLFSRNHNDKIYDRKILF